MENLFDHINWLAVLACTVSSMVLGALWYSPVLFAKAWMAEIGKKREELMGGAGKGYAIAAFCSFIVALVLEKLFIKLGVHTIPVGAKISAVLGLGFVLTAILVGDTFSKRSFKLTMITGFYHVVQMTIMGIILSAWN